MHIFFSGIGGAGIGPLALLAKQAGYAVSGSDRRESQYIHYLRSQGITTISIDQSEAAIARVHGEHPIDWYVYSSAVSIENPDAPELVFCRQHGIRMSKRDELLNEILSQKDLKLIAIAGTHGKTTTTAMTVWLAKQIQLPISYSVPAKLTFGQMGEFDPESRYFIYECDEYDHNFLAFHPQVSLITGIDWDHPDIFPTREAYYQAFRDFLTQSHWAVLWQSDVERLSHRPQPADIVLHEGDPAIEENFHLPGVVNRRNAWLVAWALHRLTDRPMSELVNHLNRFPGVARRFEMISPGLYSDYAHTPPKIRGALQTAQEVAGDNVVVVYEGIHNSRQHFIRDELAHMFDHVKQVYIVPTYLGREDNSLELLTPDKLKAILSPTAQAHTVTAELNVQLKNAIESHISQGDIVVCLSAGGGDSLDEWIRTHF